MSDYHLTIGDKNLSSWSLRPWLVLRQSGIPFRESVIRLDQPETRQALDQRSPSGLVPFFSHGSLIIWDSLAIAEYINELHPEKKLWPEAREHRAIARAIAAEMHSGFSSLRAEWPMNFLAEGQKRPPSGAVRRDIQRIDRIWTNQREQFKNSGDFLFGAFSIADAMYAPVASRFRTYGPVELSAHSAAYVETVLSLDAIGEWRDGAAREIA